MPSLSSFFFLTCLQNNDVRFCQTYHLLFITGIFNTQNSTLQRNAQIMTYILYILKKKSVQPRTGSRWQSRKILSSAHLMGPAKLFTHKKTISENNLNTGRTDFLQLRNNRCGSAHSESWWSPWQCGKQRYQPTPVPGRVLPL